MKSFILGFAKGFLATLYLFGIYYSYNNCRIAYMFMLAFGPIAFMMLNKNFWKAC